MDKVLWELEEGVADSAQGTRDNFIEEVAFGK
jgi:hypothetical protein